MNDLKDAQIDRKPTTIIMVLAKRGSEGHARTNIDERWASFDQMRMVKMKVVDSDTLNTISTKKDTTSKNNSGYKKIEINLEG